MVRASLTDPIVGNARRILLIGVTGSGKSTLARALEERHGIPAVDVDALAWRAGWVKAPEAEFVSEVGRIVAGETWVLDSAWTAIRPAVLPRTDLVVALDLPRYISLGRLFGRTLRRVVTRERVCGDNVETVRQVLSTDSIIAWHFRSFASKRRQMDAWESDPGMPPVLRLHSQRDVAEFLCRIE